MTNKQVRRYEMLVRVSEFGAAHKDRFPESSLAGQALATVDSAVQQLRGRDVRRLALRHESAPAVRHLGLIVKNTLRDDEEAMAAWDRTCRIPYRRSDAAVETPPAAPPTEEQPSADVTTAAADPVSVVPEDQAA